MNKKKNRATAREIIINKKIKDARNSVISHQIELDFLKLFKEKMDNNEINLCGNTYTNENITVLINNLSDLCVYDLERLNFYKKLRDDLNKSKMEKIAKKASEVLNNFPEKLNISEENNM